MMRPMTGSLLVLALNLPFAPAPAAAPVSTARLIARLRAAGRAEARLVQTTRDALGGKPVTTRGLLALELPDRVRLDFPASGERLTVRGDGGEWLQPAVRQMLVLNPEQARVSGELWSVMLEAGGAGFEEERRGAARFALRRRTGPTAPFDSLVIDLERGLPASLTVFSAGGETLRYRFGAWRFVKPRGAPAFTLRAPAGWAVVPLP